MEDKKHVILTHVLGWLAYVLVIALGADELDADFLQKSFVSYLPVVGIFYVNVWLLFPAYLPDRRYIPLAIWLLLVNVLAAGLRFGLTWLIHPGQFGQWEHFSDVSIIFWNQFRLNLMFIGVSFAYWYARRNYVVELHQQRLEKEVLDARLASLKNQINPHFLHNTLSFLYTKALPLSKELSDAIADLSDMMRYALDEAGEDGQVTLAKEVNHLRNFIRIHQFRYDHRLNVQFAVEGCLTGHSIMPLLLITFVENAFKHGQLNNSQHPLSICLRASATTLFFSVSNRKSGGSKEKSSGIGLQNVRNRLELTYPKAYTLAIDDCRDNYRVMLNLTLKP